MHASICDFLTDIVQNSFEADSSLVNIHLEQDDKNLLFTVDDNGKGMSEEEQKKALDPFYSDGIKHSKRKVGLGLPFLHQMIEAIGGEFTLISVLGTGTTISVVIPLNHIDTPPLGDIPSTFSSLLSYPSSAELVINRSAMKKEEREDYEVCKSELCEILGELTQVGNLVMMKTFLQSQEAAIEEFLQRV